MSLFDEQGKLNQAFAQRVYDQASGQVTGQMAAGVPILGAGMKLEEVQLADWPMVDQCIEHVKAPLEQGAPPDAPVMVALYQFAQLMRLLDSLRPAPEADEPPTTSLGTIFQALKECIPHIKRQEIHGKHEQDRIDAADWLSKYEKQIEWLNSKPESEFRIHLDAREE